MTNPFWEHIRLTHSLQLPSCDKMADNCNLFENLPPEMLMMIFCNLDLPTLLALAATCKWFVAAARELWFKKYLEKFHELSLKEGDARLPPLNGFRVPDSASKCAGDDMMFAKWFLGFPGVEEIVMSINRLPPALAEICHEGKKGDSCYILGNLKRFNIAYHHPSRLVSIIKEAIMNSDKSTVDGAMIFFSSVRPGTMKALIDTSKHFDWTPCPQIAGSMALAATFSVLPHDFNVCWRRRIYNIHKKHIADEVSRLVMYYAESLAIEVELRINMPATATVIRDVPNVLFEGLEDYSRRIREAFFIDKGEAPIYYVRKD